MPSATSWRTARGVRPSPQTFSLGNAVLSSRTTSSPAWARYVAAVDPPGPAPTTMTLACRSVVADGAGWVMAGGSFDERVAVDQGVGPHLQPGIPSEKLHERRRPKSRTWSMRGRNRYTACSWCLNRALLTGL